MFLSVFSIQRNSRSLCSVSDFYFQTSIYAYCKGVGMLVMVSLLVVEHNARIDCKILITNGWACKEFDSIATEFKVIAGSHCGCRYQQDYRPTLGRDGKKESGTLEVIKFYYDGAIRFEQHCYGEAATFVFGVWADHMDPDGTLHWVLPDRRKSYYDEDYLPKKLDRVDEAGNLYFDGGVFPWKLADDFAEDKRWGYPKWKVALGKLTGKGKKGD